MPRLFPALAGAGLVALTALAVWLVWPAFEPGRIVNLDAPRHLLRSQVMAEQFLPAGHVDGWSPFWYLGAQLFLFQSYGYFFLIGASALVLAPLWSIEQVFKVWYALPIVLLPAATAWMARRLGVGVCGALTAALASLTFSSPIGYGLQGVYGVGLLLQGVGLVVFALAWPELVRTLNGERGAMGRTALILGAALVLHFITGAYLLAAGGGVAAVLAISDRSRAPLLRYGLLVVLALLLAAHSLMPSLELHELAGAGVGWGRDRARFDRFLDGSLFGAPWLSHVALIAAAWALWRARTPLRVTALVFFATAWVAGTEPRGWEPTQIGQILDVLVRPRALPYVALLQALFVGYGVDAALIGVDRWAGQERRLSARVAAAALLFLLGLVALPEAIAQRHFVRTESMLQQNDRRVYERLVEWLRRHVPSPAIVAVPRGLFPLEVLGARSVISLLNMDTGLYTLGGDQAELSHSVRRAGQVDLHELGDHRPQDVAMLRAAGVSYVVVSASGARKRLRGDPDFRRVFEYDAPVGSEPLVRRDGRLKKPLGVAVYRLRKGGRWLRGAGVRVLGMTHTPERIEWALDAQRGTSLRPVVAAINWHPNWKAEVDGRSVPTFSSSSGRVSLLLPPNSGHLTLAFQRSAREVLWNWLSLGTLLMLLASWLRNAARARKGHSI